MKYEEAIKSLPREAKIFTQEDFNNLPEKKQKKALEHINGYEEAKGEEQIAGIIGRTSAFISGICVVYGAYAFGAGETVEKAVGIAIAFGVISAAGYLSKKWNADDAATQEAALLDLKFKNRYGR